MIRLLPLVGMFLAAQLVFITFIAHAHTVHQAVVEEVGRPPQDTRRPPGALKRWIKGYTRERRAEIRRRERRRKQRQSVGAGSTSATTRDGGASAGPTGGASAPPAPASSSVWDQHKHALAECESGNNPRAVNPSGKYRGLLQFDLPTWGSVGMSGDPIDHSYEQQMEAGRRLHAARGFQPWPRCAARLGLL